MALSIKVSVKRCTRDDGNQWLGFIESDIQAKNYITVFSVWQTPLCNDMCPNQWFPGPLVHLFSNTLRRLLALSNRNYLSVSTTTSITLSTGILHIPMDFQFF